MTEKYEIIQELETEFGMRFHLLPQSWTQVHVANFRRATPQDARSLSRFWESTRELGGLAMQRALSTQLGWLQSLASEVDQQYLAVCIPRGAYPAAQGVREYRPLPLIVTNDGGKRDPSKPLIPRETPQMHVGTLILVDPVIDTGATYERTIAGLGNHGIKVDLVVAVAVVAHPPTVERLLRQNPLLHIVTADVENNTVPAADGSGGRWLAGFGDIGANVEAASATLPELSRHTPTPGYYLAAE